MTQAWSPRLGATVGVLLLVLLAGCGGPKMVTVRGALLYQGKPYKASEKTYVTVMFAPSTDKPGQTYPAKYTRTEGTYTVTVPAGPYKVGIIVDDKESGQFLSVPAAQSKIHDLTDDRQLDLDLAK